MGEMGRTFVHPAQQEGASCAGASRPVGRDKPGHDGMTKLAVR
ncbi:hypothetical protein SAMN05428997_10111 [Bosea sp. CRIB-10]|nr:hypothetical protein SAMN05428997_10111 [Bosea sp. CRIB-10]